MKKNIISLIGILALALVFGLALAGCKTDADDGGSSIDTALVAQWYVDEEFTTVGYEFKSDGKLLVAGSDAAGITVTTADDKITTSAAGTTLGSAGYSITGKTLTINNAGMSGLVSGTYYKK